MTTQIRECKRDNLCADCNDKKCWFAGQLIADCPLWQCDRQGELYEDCKSCALLKQIHRQKVKCDDI